jgi:hypothetical protein
MRVGSGAEEQNCGGACGPGAERRAKDPASGDDGAEELGIEKFGDEIGDGHGSPAHQIEHALLAEAANAAAGLQQIPQIFWRRRVDTRRRGGEELVQNREEIFERFGEFSVFRGVLGGEARNAAGSLGVAAIEEEGFSVGRGGEEAGIGMQDVAFVFFELHVQSDVGAQRTEGVGQGGGAEARIKFFGDGATADEFAALEDQRLEAAFGEIESGDQSVVTAADEDYALSQGHGQLFSTGDGEVAATSVGGWEAGAAG